MKTKLFQWCLFALLIGFAFMLQNCQEEDSTTLEEIQNSTELGAKKIKDDKDKLDVCHYDVATGLWSLKSYSVNSVPQHLLHGDVVLVDADGDGYVTAINECVPGGDCDDTDPTVNPGATEVCDGIDNNCDGSVDEGFDLDGDGFTVCQGDCDDSDPSVYPGSTEICDNGIDDNCDGQIDEDCDSDTDGDGVPDGIDLCPNTPSGHYNQVNQYGCAWIELDDDDDGVLNGVDACPYNPGPPETNGCPDSDGDGVPDYIDDCPEIPGQPETNGCPIVLGDTDRDGVPDSEDDCPETPFGQEVDADGCPIGDRDGDGDGVPDGIDLCPNTPPGHYNQVSPDGCAWIELDDDDDGVLNGVDLCPYEPGSSEFYGCPDL